MIHFSWSGNMWGSLFRRGMFLKNAYDIEAISMIAYQKSFDRFTKNFTFHMTAFIEEVIAQKCIEWLWTEENISFVRDGSCRDRLKFFFFISLLCNDADLTILLTEDCTHSSECGDHETISNKCCKKCSCSYEVWLCKISKKMIVFFSDIWKVSIFFTLIPTRRWDWFEKMVFEDAHNIFSFSTDNTDDCDITMRMENMWSDENLTLWILVPYDVERIVRTHWKTYWGDWILFRKLIWPK